ITTPLPPPSTVRPPMTLRITCRFTTDGASRSTTRVIVAEYASSGSSSPGGLLSRGGGAGPSRMLSTNSGSPQSSWLRLRSGPLMLLARRFMRRLLHRSLQRNNGLMGRAIPRLPELSAPPLGADGCIRVQGGRRIRLEDHHRAVFLRGPGEGVVSHADVSPSLPRLPSELRVEAVDAGTQTAELVVLDQELVHRLHDFGAVAPSLLVRPRRYTFHIAGPQLM